ncbi:MAG: FAD-dependent oxidoreductase [Chloroflexota bacterium]
MALGPSRGASPDVVVIGGGIMGVATAAHLASGGRRVLLLERDVLGAGASGRNSGIVQHPMQPAFGPLHLRTLDLYRRLDEAQGGTLRLPAAPVGLLSVSHDPAVARREAATLGRDLGDLAPVYLDADDVRRLEPAFGPGVHACRIEAAYPVQPIAATLAYGAWARSLGAEVREGQAATPWVEHGRVLGVRLADGTPIAAADVVVAAGPWTPQLVDPTGRWRPIRPLWGVVVTVGLVAPPRHVAEEAASSMPSSGGSAADVAEAGHEDERSGAQAGIHFSLVTAGGATSLGSSFLDGEPDVGSVADRIVAHGATFVPAVADAPRLAVRACARPVSRDGNPLIGRIGWVDGLWVVTGHGPWGISTGPGSALLLAELMDGHGATPPPVLDPKRFEAP